jgi:hypothetical protein
MLNAFYPASYLLVITSRSDVGHCKRPLSVAVVILTGSLVFDASHSIYGVKSVVSIPLVRDRAKAVLSRIASRNASGNRPSLLVSDDDDPQPSERASGGPQVKFADEEEVRILTPLAKQVNFSVNNNSRPVSPGPSSGTSTPISDESVTNSPVMTIANRMSFWGRPSKRESSISEAAVRDIEHSLLDERESLSSAVQDTLGEAGEVISSIIAATAPAPGSSEERHTELEGRILREFIREFTKGDMYFALHFGECIHVLTEDASAERSADITRSLQHKREQFAKLHAQNKLLAELDVLPKDTALNPLDDEVNVLFEPSAMLPLWRRVDRQFWWNEWLSKPLIDAGVSAFDQGSRVTDTIVP